MSARKLDHAVRLGTFGGVNASNVRLLSVGKVLPNTRLDVARPRMGAASASFRDCMVRLSRRRLGRTPVAVSADPPESRRESLPITRRPGQASMPGPCLSETRRHTPLR